MPVIDGIFVPIPNTQTLVNSEGGRFGGIGNESHYTHSCFVVGKLHATDNWNLTDHYIELLLEVAEIESCLPDKERAFMDIHANLGVTFDLNAVHRQTGRKVTQYICNPPALLVRNY